MDNLEQLVTSAIADFALATEPAPLEDAKARYLGKEGSLTVLLKGLGKLPPDERKRAGAAINVAKERIESALAARREALKMPGSKRNSRPRRWTSRCRGAACRAARCIR